MDSSWYKYYIYFFSKVKVAGVSRFFDMTELTKRFKRNETKRETKKQKDTKRKNTETKDNVSTKSKK